MKRIDITKSKDGWVAKSGSSKLATGTTKDEVVRKTAAAARKDSAAVTVKIHKQDGTFQEERTYPRTADPRKSKG